MDLYFRTTIFSDFEKESIGSVQFNRKIINMMLSIPT